MRIFFINNSWWLVSLITFVLLIIHTFSISDIKIDNITLALLLLLLISPFISQIKKIKWGELEAEIDPKEIQKVKDVVDAKISLSISNSKNGEPPIPEAEEIFKNIMTMVETDYILALAKLRIVLVQKVCKLYRLALGTRDNRESVTIAKIIHELSLREVLPIDFAHPLKEILYFCNRVVHGERIKVNDSKKIIEIGIALYIYIDNLIYDYLVKPLETYQVSDYELEKYQKSQYKVVTLIPYAHGVVKNIRVVKKEELDELLDDYGCYSEFIIEIKAISEEV